MAFSFSYLSSLSYYSIFGEKINRLRRKQLSSCDQVIILKQKSECLSLTVMRTTRASIVIYSGVKSQRQLQWNYCSNKRLIKLYSEKGYSQKQTFTQQEQEDHDDEEEEPEELEMERLFSNLNQITLKPEPGSLTSAILLVSGTTVGAGILAIPAVTQESGFLASAVTCIFCWVFMVVTGLLVAEVNVKTMCELGSGGVSLVSMARRTLGTTGVQIACWSYIFIHYALLVAYVARSSDILTSFLGIPPYEQ